MAGTGDVMGQAPPDVPVQQSDTPNQIPTQPDPGAAMGGGMPQRPQPQQPSPQQQEEAHHSMFGRAAKFLLGQPTTSYQVNPQTGATEATQVPQRPGQMFRSLVAGAILGGAAGSENAGKGGFAGGMMRGAQAVQDRGQEQDLQKRAQAEAQFKNQMAAKKDTREQQAQDEESKVRDANIALMNAQTLHANFALQEAKDVRVDREIESGKAFVQPYIDADIPMPYKDVSENEMHDIQSKNPLAMKYQWELTGKQVERDKDGNPFIAKTYSAVDPKGQVTMTAGILKQFTDDKLEKYVPGVATMKPGQVMDAKQYMALVKQDKDIHNQNLLREQQGLATRHTETEIKEANARTQDLLAQASERTLMKKDKQDFDTAMNEFNKVGGDYDKLTPKSQVIFATNLPKLINDQAAAVRAASQADPDPQNPTVKKGLEDLNLLMDLQTKAFKGKQPPTATAPPKPPKPGTPLSADVAQKYMLANGGDKAKARSAAQADGWDIGASGPVAQDPRYQSAGAAASNLTPTSSFPVSPFGQR